MRQMRQMGRRERRDGARLRQVTLALQWIATGLLRDPELTVSRR